MTVWITIIPTSTFYNCVFLLFFFFFFFSAVIVDFVNSEQCICVLFTVPQITLFSNFFIKNGSHSTIYTFKNYFATVFSVSVFSFSKNKLNPNTPNYHPLPSWENFHWSEVQLLQYICEAHFYASGHSPLLTFHNRPTK